jgi:hypothetical protein
MLHTFRLFMRRNWELPRHNSRHGRGEKMKQYETPVLVAAGTFRKVTGLLQRHGNDRLILSKN